ncbi:trans-aconitate 2-methyltransferase [Streptacidiphilus sp. MAP5-52]|uniref:class I SAM-dependent methyltransferase n=1 Tax=Streptacidiphilus sp. MAP5-52 TaxID=3156267 RepID=UPI0035118383
MSTDPTTGSATGDTANALAWNRIAQDEPDTGQGRPPVPADISWSTHPGDGPGAEILGTLTGAVVAELGCGTGDHLAYVATRGARQAIGIDSAEHRIRQARTRWQHLPSLVWTTGDAGQVLDAVPEPVDVCYSIFGALWYSDPERLLPRIHAALRPGGRLAFSVGRARPGRLQGARVDNLTLADGTRLPVVHYGYDAAAWTDLLNRHGFTGVSCVEVPARRAGANPTLVLTAARPRG